MELVIAIPAFHVLQFPEWLGVGGVIFSIVWAREGQMNSTWFGANSL